MSGRIHTYYFGRLNLLGHIGENKTEFILQSLNSGSRLLDVKFNYMFTDVQLLLNGQESFITGFLVKYKQELEAERVDEAKRRIVEDSYPDAVVAKVPFFLHSRTSVIAYRPISSRLSDEQFRKKFARLFEEGLGSFFITAKIDSINEELGVLTAVDNLKKINWVSIEIRPTNPSNRPIYRDLDQDLKELRAEKLKEEIVAGDAGLSREALKGNNIYKGIVMAVDGYGTAAIGGVSPDDRSVVIRTTDSPETIQIIDLQSSEGSLDSLMGSFRRIWERLRNDNKSKAD